MEKEEPESGQDNEQLRIKREKGALPAELKLHRRCCLSWAVKGPSRGRPPLCAGSKDTSRDDSITDMRMDRKPQATLHTPLRQQNEHVSLFLLFRLRRGFYQPLQPLCHLAKGRNDWFLFGNHQRNSFFHSLSSRTMITTKMDTFLRKNLKKLLRVFHFPSVWWTKTGEDHVVMSPLVKTTYGCVTGRTCKHGCVAAETTHWTNSQAEMSGLREQSSNECLSGFGLAHKRPWSQFRNRQL